jgi:hypothetical protein
MNYQKPNIVIQICWYVVSPLFILVIWAFNWYDYQPIKYGNKEFSAGAMAFGWCIALISIISIPSGAIHTILSTSSSKSFYEVNYIFIYIILIKLCFNINL